MLNQDPAVFKINKKYESEIEKSEFITLEASFYICYDMLLSTGTWYVHIFFRLNAEYR